MYSLYPTLVVFNSRC